MILEQTVDLIKSIYKYHRIITPKIKRVVIGLGYTGVELLAYAYDPLLGLAYTLPTIIQESECSKINFAGSLTNKKLGELLEWSYGPPSIKKIIGIATLNAMSQHILQIQNPYRKIKGNLIDYLEIKDNTKVTFVGQIRPLIKNIGRITDSITIIENLQNINEAFRKFPNYNDINQIEDEDLRTDILFCTGTTLINNTILDILERYKKKAGKLIVIGPTASMLPDILFDYGVDIVGGMRITDVESTIRVI
ncbi:MAG: Rossmann-like domain-containing protein, partial [Candidatus Hermodarchaeota archaeon]